MVWFIYGILSAFFDGTYYALVKKFLQNMNKSALASGAFFTSSFFFLIASLVKGIPDIGNEFYSSVIITGSLNVIAAIFYYKAFEITDLSLAVPMLSFTPVILIFSSFIILKELPTVYGIMGIFLIVTGSYILNVTKGRTKFLDPIKNIFKNKGMIYMLIAAFMFGIAPNYDKLVVLNSNQIFGSFVVHLFIGSCFFIITLFNKVSLRKIYTKNFYKFLVIGGSFALTTFFMNMALNLQIVPYVISLKRTSILFSVVFGGWMFKEKNMIRRFVGAFIMLIGVIVIIIF